MGPIAAEPSGEDLQCVECNSSFATISSNGVLAQTVEQSVSSLNCDTCCKFLQLHSAVLDADRLWEQYQCGQVHYCCRLDAINANRGPHKDFANFLLELHQVAVFSRNGPLENEARGTKRSRSPEPPATPDESPRAHKRSKDEGRKVRWDESVIFQYEPQDEYTGDEEEDNSPSIEGDGEEADEEISASPASGETTLDDEVSAGLKDNHSSNMGDRSLIEDDGSTKAEGEKAAEGDAEGPREHPTAKDLPQNEAEGVRQVACQDGIEGVSKDIVEGEADAAAPDNAGHR